MPLEPGKPVVICRRAVPPEPIEPSYFQGFQCCMCGVPLQLSEFGLKQVLEGGQAVCNPCGGKIVSQITAMSEAGEIPASASFEVRILPHATNQVERITGKPATDSFPSAKIEFV